MNAEDIFRCSIGCEIMLMIKARIRLIFSRYTFPLLTLCMLGNFSCVRCHLLTFSQKKKIQKILSRFLSVSNGLDLDQDQSCVGPDLVPGCFTKASLSADNNNYCQHEKSLIWFNVWMIKTVLILIRWLHQLLADLDLHSIQKRLHIFF